MTNIKFRFLFQILSLGNSFIIYTMLATNQVDKCQEDDCIIILLVRFKKNKWVNVALFQNFKGSLI